MYHSFSENSGKYHRSPTIFRKHVKNVSIDENLVITIDDGVPRVFTIAFPILQEYNVKSIIFLDTKEIGKSRMNIEQIKEMSEMGHNFQSHSHTHRSHFSLSRKEIEEEGIISKDIIEQITGKKVTKYCFPHSLYSTNMCEILSQIGYSEFYTGDYGWKSRYYKGKYKIFDRIDVFKEIDDIRYFLRRDIIVRKRFRGIISKIKNWEFKYKH